MKIFHATFQPSFVCFQAMFLLLVACAPAQESKSDKPGEKGAAIESKMEDSKVDVMKSPSVIAPENMMENIVVAPTPVITESKGMETKVEVPKTPETATTMNPPVSMNMESTPDTKPKDGDLVVPNTGLLESFTIGAVNKGTLTAYYRVDLTKSEMAFKEVGLDKEAFRRDQFGGKAVKESDKKTLFDELAKLKFKKQDDSACVFDAFAAPQGRYVEVKIAGKVIRFESKGTNTCVEGRDLYVDHSAIQAMWFLMQGPLGLH